jgi:hypothetical protein
MPKETKYYKLKRFSKLYPNQFDTDGQILNCTICNITVNANKKFQVDQHVKSHKHQAKLNKLCEKNDNSKQQFLTQMKIPSSSYNQRLCEALISSGISFNALNNTKFRKILLEKPDKIPDASTLKKYSVPKCYLNMMNRIRSELEDNKIWISIDETTNALGRYVDCVVVGKLSYSSENKCFLLHCTQLEQANLSTIAKDHRR